ncbi:MULTISPECIES: cobalamin biosynthesis protein [Streptomyces]|uniref:cobalamin biosynthesis protein n=1 Tax=Streptomyces TaxID=1883 RepID=UPI001CCAAE0A|nr:MULTISPECIES: cobalamin biosynthesis protein [Streptomyces]UBI39542.1 cobalamin biosynthesis protein [Streptomyces mobaraensis]UKW32121.1 cobalamin biosynthesis protein [Streptomyces sp. TYQ1024]
MSEPVYVGLGARPGASADEVLALIARCLPAGVRPVALATVAARAAEPGVVAAAARLGVPIRAYGAAELARVPVPHPSAVADAAVGTPSVAEAAALLAAGGGAVLLVPKRVSGRVTCAVAG